MSEVLREVVDWHDDSNVYQQGAMYLAVNPARQPLGTMGSNRNSLDKWLTFWEQPDSKSIEGKIKLTESSSQAPTSIERIESPTGPLPSIAGADISKVGPGSAYHSR